MEDDECRKLANKYFDRIYGYDNGEIFFTDKRHLQWLIQSEPGLMDKILEILEEHFSKKEPHESLNYENWQILHGEQLENET